MIQASAIALNHIFCFFINESVRLLTVYFSGAKLLQKFLASKINERLIGSYIQEPFVNVVLVSFPSNEGNEIH